MLARQHFDALRNVEASATIMRGGPKPLRTSDEVSPSVVNPIKQRRAELDLTQQEAARRAGVSLATWRRFENEAADAGTLAGFRSDNIKGFGRTLGLSVQAVRQLVATTPDDAPEDDSYSTAATVRLFNKSFTGDPLTPADAMALAQTVAFSDFAPTVDGRFHVESALGCGFPAYLKGEATIRDVDLLRDLPELALTQVNNHWLTRMGERIMHVGSELDEGRVPRPVCFADEYALSAVIFNTDPPQLSDILDMYPGLRDAESVFGHDPDLDDPEDTQVGREDWLNRMIGGLLPPAESRDFRRLDLTLIEFYRQGVYDPADPRHPLRWFDRDDLRDRCESEIAHVRLPQDGRS
jgi:transcriptional regulator with XRE-family HTH domain